MVISLFSFKEDYKGNFIKILSKPAQGLTNFGKNTKNLFSFVSNISNLKEQNKSLTETLQNLEVDRSKIIELEYENATLKRELGYTENNPESKLLSARIIGREPTSFLDYVIIDKGEKSGIKTGMAAISGGVLVGQVKDVYDDHSKIILITSKDSLILAMLQNSRSKGILKGGISGLVLENITQDEDYKAGEYVVTSGLDGELKPGILIGKTTNIETSSSDLYKNISVESIADLSRLELVFIIIE